MSDFKNGVQNHGLAIRFMQINVKFNTKWVTALGSLKKIFRASSSQIPQWAT